MRILFVIIQLPKKYNNRNVNQNVTSALCIICKFYKEVDIPMYINHYINYLGFNHIYMYVYNSKFDIKKYENMNVTVIDANKLNIKNPVQQNIYNDFIKSDLFQKYDFTAFFDDDELLWVSDKYNHNVNKFLSYNNNMYYLIPWRFIGGNVPLHDRNNSYKDTYFYVDKSISWPLLNKVILRKDAVFDFSFHEVHSVIFKSKITPWVNKNSRLDTHYTNNCNIICTHLFEYDYNYCDIMLYHYAFRTQLEYIEKLNSKMVCTFDDQIVKNTYFADLEYKTNYDLYINPFNV